MMAEQMTFETGQGVIARPEGGSGPGVLVLHAWWGLTPFFSELCDRLAAAGFVAVAPDFYGSGQTAETIPEAEALAQGMDGDQAGAIIKAALATLQQEAVGAHVGAIGFSLGSGWVVELGEPAKALISFYDAAEVGDNVASDAAFMGHFAANDEYEEQQYIDMMADALREKGISVTLHTYPDANHWFFETNRPQYAPDAADLAWERTLTFLRAHLG